MGCSSCGKSVAHHAGSTANTAIVFGDIDNIVRRVRFMRDVGGLLAGAVKYVRGSGVQTLIDDGSFSLLAGGARAVTPMRNGQSLYYVNGIGYTDMGTARVRSSQTGFEIIVRTIGE